MADAHTSRLCAQIAHSHFGPLTASVVNALLTRGRLTFSQIVRFTPLNPRTARAAILILVQHNIVWHSVTEEEGEVLEVNIDECLIRLRFGRFAWQAEELFGRTGGEIVQLILDHGKLRPPDIIGPLSGGSVKESAVYAQTLHKLVSAAYLKPSTLLSHVSPRDKRIKYEAEEKAKITGFPTAKELRQAKEAAEARMKREEAEAEKIGLKRKPIENGHRSSKKKAVEEEEIVDDTVYFRINYQRFSVHIRNSLIEQAARERYNDGAAAVVRATLQASAAKQFSLEDPRTDPVSIANIAQHIHDDDNLASGLLSASKKPNTMACLKDYLGILSAADNPTPAGRAGAFLSFSSSKIQVEFEVVARRLKKRVLEAVAREKHGDEGVRIIRLLLDVGKMDEKQVSKSVMMPNKDVRPLLSALAGDSLISTQEVAKTADHNPTRTFYLWYVDLQKAYSVILGQLYKTLYNIGTRREAEQEEPNVKAVLDKMQRSDVAADNSLLSRMEQETLKEWEAKRQKLVILQMRVEEAVFIVKDLGVLGNSDD
ncbi:hypothetical protein PLEOSDRAFT_1073903 [Pleurotus ostreatus PC15]|uniref:DNA-directed RNA polymerase III subunit RPC3 n=1 Tax=Pleurotus ostreatus (strain PC15) TaxID=1137138 RepID=A0A067P079_PLEO1|nr:hypothetical protein PLEOSDRAFT_1073903 [Pleurotus ostreatus PC15]